MQKEKKKKKRRLKKSVRRGCFCIVFIIALIPAFFLYRCRPQLFHFGKSEEVTEEVIEPDSIDLLLAASLEKAVEHSLRIDTTQLAISVYDLTRGCSVYEYHSQQLLIPASCMKLLTAVSAFKQLGLGHTYSSKMYKRGNIAGGNLQGDLLLVMDDDPLIETFAAFTNALVAKGITRIEGAIQLDLMRTDTLKQHPTAKPWDIPYNKVPLLMKGSKRIERELLYALHAKGISYAADTCQFLTNASTDGADLLYEETHPLREVMAPMLIHSSNIKAESILYHTQHAFDRQSSDETPQVQSSLDFIHSTLKYDSTQGFVINDGSGLSPENRLSADFLIHLMRYAYADEELRSVLLDEALATPAHPIRHGSLLGRMRQPIFHNRIFCKTGTMVTTGSSSLTGYAENENGRWFAFSIINGNSAVYESRVFQDGVCRILVSPIR